MRDAEVLAAVDAAGRRDARDRDAALPPLTHNPRMPDDAESPSGSPRPISRSTTSSGSPTGRRVELAPDAVDRIRASRAVVDALVDGPTLIYGLNTGLGHLRDVQVPRETLRQYQELIVVGHEGAIGDPLPTEVVRAAIAVRLNGIARGGSGASLPVAEGLAALLNRGVHPIVRDDGLGRGVGPDAHGRDRPGPDRAGVGPRWRGEVLPGGRGPRPRRPRAHRPRAQGRPRPDLGQRRVDRARGARRRAGAARRPRRRPRARGVARGRLGQPVGARCRRPRREARPGPGRRGRRHPRVPRRQRPVHAGRPGVGPGPALVPRRTAGPRRVPRVHRRPRAPGDDRAQRDGRQPARRRRVGPDAQQRQLPPDGPRHRARRDPAGDRPRRAALRPAHEPPLGAPFRADLRRRRRGPDRRAGGGLLRYTVRCATPSSGSLPARRRSTSDRSTSASRTMPRTRR